MQKEIESLLQAKVKRDPFQHQIDALEYFYDKPEALFLWEMGTGKTGGAIYLQRLRCFQERKFVNTIIVTPLVTVYNWAEEFKNFSPYPEDRILALTQESGAKKLAYLKKKLTTQDNFVIITNYESLLNAEIYTELIHSNYDCLILDEAHRVKDPKTKRAKACTRLADKAKYKMLLTGTLILNSIKDVYSPFRILDKGDTFGTNQYIFHNTYMKDVNASWKGKSGYFPDWKVRDELLETIHQKIYAKAVRKLKSECLDLPPFTKEIAYVELGKEQEKHYKEMKRDFITFVKSHENAPNQAVVAELAMTKALRLLQIACGFVTTEDKNEILFKENPRLDRCKELLETIVGEGNKCILWASFKSNYKMLANVCDELGIKYVMLTGQQDIGEKNDSIKAFQNDAETRVIIANRRAGGIGVNLTSASYSIVYSRNFSLEEEEQSEARNYRSGSEQHTSITKIDLACKGTIDEECLLALINKKNFASLIIDSKYLEENI